MAPGNASGPYDVTIVGAGMAGLYAAWRLLNPAVQQASPLLQQLIRQNGTGALQVCVLEQSNTPGGRLDSYTFTQDGADVTVELGGMRFQKSMQLVDNLVNSLGLSVTQFPQAKNRLFYLRGASIWENEIMNPNAPVKLPYANLPPDTQNMSPDQLFNKVVQDVTGNQDAPDWSMDQWRTFVEQNAYTSPSNPPVFANMAYTELAFWNLLYDQVGEDGYRYLTEGGAYDSNTINWNAALAMPYVASGDYGTSASYLRLVGGYQTLPDALSLLIGGANFINYNTRAAAVSQDSATGLINVATTNGPHQGNVQTKYLMLCMPRRALELLDPETPFSQELNPMLDKVIRQPAFKLLMLFDQEWWKQVNIRGTGLQPYGPTISDLPLRMIWYFDDATVKRRDGKPMTQNFWALLASYSDMTNEQFWIGMRNPLAPGGGLYGKAIPAPPQMVNMALAQLALVHGMTIPQPIAAVYKDWAVDPFGAGYHAWAAHLDPWLSYDLMLKPLVDYNVFICGEAYSLDQGWVEGSLRTVETVLNNYFQVPPPGKVAASYVKRSRSDGH